MKLGILSVCACAVIGLAAPAASNAALRSLQFDSALPCGDNGQPGGTWVPTASNPFPDATFDPGPSANADTLSTCAPNESIGDLLTFHQPQSGFTATDAFMYAWAGTTIDAQAVVWTLADISNGATDYGSGFELALAGWCSAGTGSASLKWGGATYTTSCATNGTTPNDLLFNAAGAFVGYYDDSIDNATGPVFTSTPPAGWNGTTTTNVPEPDSLVWMLLGIPAALLLRRRARLTR